MRDNLLLPGDPEQHLFFMDKLQRKKEQKKAAVIFFFAVLLFISICRLG